MDGAVRKPLDERETIALVACLPFARRRRTTADRKFAAVASIAIACREGLPNGF